MRRVAISSGVASYDPATGALTGYVPKGATAAVTAALVAGIFDHYFFNLYFPQTIALFWLTMGLAMSARRLGLSVSEERGTPLVPTAEGPSRPPVLLSR
ncbi:MAG: hypothetical protein K6U89_18945 [Chloroflexi bacterium]|nr:hypothetical protein [Chloroflexota bacterium]